MAAKLSLAKIDDAIRDYIAGDAPSVIRARYGIGNTTLFRYLRQRGIPKSYRRVEVPTDEIAARYIAGESENVLAAAYSTSRQVIRRRLIEAGASIRGQTDANRLLASQRSPEEIARLTAPMHLASRGREKTFKQKCNSAISRERAQSHATESERLLASWLTDRGLSPVLQKAIGPYNIDVAVSPVAVEIYGGGWHAYGNHAALSRKRFEYILNNSWAAVVVWVSQRDCPLSIAAADYVVSFLEQVRSNPSLIGQYRVILGNGKDVTVEGKNIDYLTVKPSFAGR